VVVAPEEGRLAGGDRGAGRLADPSVIVARVQEVLATGRDRDLAGRHVLVSAGGTREPLDPVRVLTNRSSGKQGHAVAEAAVRRGAFVTLVTAASLPAAPGIRVIGVETAADMEAAMLAEAPAADVVVMAAAVSDFRPKAVSQTKLAKEDGVPGVVLERTNDILAALGASRQPGQVLVGFAAETGEPLERGRRKLISKGVDLMVVNDVTAPGAGFDHDTNVVTILSSDGTVLPLPLQSKLAVAGAILDVVAGLLGGDSLDSSKGAVSRVKRPAGAGGAGPGRSIRGSQQSPRSQHRKQAT
jgi:phosphopantothenoylcysteine decarboxylase/phosphopantothenate--cysteine ligase